MTAAVMLGLSTAVYAKLENLITVNCNQRYEIEHYFSSTEVHQVYYLLNKLSLRESKGCKRLKFLIIIIKKQINTHLNQKK